GDAFLVVVGEGARADAIGARVAVVREHGGVGVGAVVEAEEVADLVGEGGEQIDAAGGVVAGGEGEAGVVQGDVGVDDLAGGVVARDDGERDLGRGGHR